jgi:hypothetical protein
MHVVTQIQIICFNTIYSYNTIYSMSLIENDITPPNKTCGCYAKDSSDSRCCGLCYLCCPDNQEYRINKCECCPKNLCDNYNITNKSEIMNDGHKFCWCLICLPFSIGCFLPCVLGASFNTFINHIRETDLNYLF